MTPDTTDPQSALQQHFGWNEFKPGQLELINRLLEGKSAVAVFPTGGGKSLGYQLPALMLDGLTVVVSPLIALMKDQIDFLQGRGVPAVRLDSSLSLDEYRQTVNQIRAGDVKLLYVAPERFFNERFRSAFDGIPISLFAIDEAHCISQWGHNFRPDYLKLSGIAKRLQVQRVLCLTATATPEVQADIQRAFDIPDDCVICTPFYRPNLHLRSQIVTQESRDTILLEKLQNSPPGATVIYVTLQKTAEQVATLCQSAGLDAQAYHAGMDSDKRSEIQEWFMHGDNRIVVATIAFGMGIDKADIRYVYHYNPPKSIESYAQEIGRAGRDGQTAHCETLFVPEDQITLENFVFGDTPSLPSIETMIAELARQPREFFISLIKLSNFCDIRSIVTQTLMTYLELDGYLEATSPRYDSYSFKPNISSTELLRNFSGERQQFVRNLLACSRKRQVWCTIDISEAITKLKCERERIIKALEYFHEKGWIELKTSGLVHGYRKLQPIESDKQLAQSLFEQVSLREAHEVERTRNIQELFSAHQCQWETLSAHFGQPLNEPCGQCSFCQQAGPFEIPAPVYPDLTPETLQQMTQLTRQHPAALNSSRAIARFLCGIGSPALTRAKLSKHALFGSCEMIPFDHVIQQIDSHVALSSEPPF